MTTLVRNFALFAAAAALYGTCPAATALEVPAGEESALKSCEKRLCTMILDKDPKGGDLFCVLTKTWAKSSLENGKDKGVSWGFGDARCAAKVTLTRADVVAALTRPSHTIRVPPQKVACEVERGGEVKPLSATLAPKLEFKNGKADKLWINLKDIDGPGDITGTIWTAATLEDSIGIFHRPMIKSINKFLHRQCAKRYGPEAIAREKKEKRKADAARRKAKSAAAKKQPDSPRNGEKLATGESGREPATSGSEVPTAKAAP